MDEEHSKAEGRGEMSETELLIMDQFTILVRDLYAFYPLLIRFVDYNRYSALIAQYHIQYVYSMYTHCRCCVLLTLSCMIINSQCLQHRVHYNASNTASLLSVSVIQQNTSHPSVL